MAPIANYDAKLARFCAWLRENGATHPKIEWPSTDTVGGCRGAKAKSRIDTNEVMMEVRMRMEAGERTDLLRISACSCSFTVLHLSRNMHV